MLSKIKEVAKTIFFDNADTELESENVRDAILESRDSIRGGIFSLTYAEGGVARNEYLEHIGNNSGSTFAVVPFNCRLISITFSNEDEDIDTDVRVVKAEYNSGTNTNTPVEIQLRNVRTAAYSNFEDEVTFSAGDKVAVYLNDAGGNPSDVVVKLYFQVSSVNRQNLSENFSGDFEGSGGFIDIFLGLDL